MMDTSKEMQPARIAAGRQPQTNAPTELVSSLNAILADLFVLYVKTKSFHWHIGGPHFRDYHLLLDDQATQILAVTDLIAERVRKLGGRTLGSIGDIARIQRLPDSKEVSLGSTEMLAELRRDNSQLVSNMREAHELTSAHGDVATASLLENWIDEAEGRLWFLSATSSAERGDSSTILG